MPEIGRERLLPYLAPAKSRCRAQTYRVGSGRHFVRPRNSPFQPPFRTGSCLSVSRNGMTEIALAKKDTVNKSQNWAF